MPTEIHHLLSNKIQQIQDQVSQTEAHLIELLERQARQQTLLAEQVESLASQLNTLQALLLHE